MSNLEGLKKRMQSSLQLGTPKTGSVAVKSGGIRIVLNLPRKTADTSRKK